MKQVLTHANKQTNKQTKKKTCFSRLSHQRKNPLQKKSAQLVKQNREEEEEEKKIAYERTKQSKKKNNERSVRRFHSCQLHIRAVSLYSSLKKRKRKRKTINKFKKKKRSSSEIKKRTEKPYATDRAIEPKGENGTKTITTVKKEKKKKRDKCLCICGCIFHTPLLLLCKMIQIQSPKRRQANPLLLSVSLFYSFFF